MTAPQQASNIVGTYGTYNGALVSIPANSAVDYAQMRASQLNALNVMMLSEGFQNFSDEVKQSTQWLAATLSDELQNLIGIVHKDL